MGERGYREREGWERWSRDGHRVIRGRDDAVEYGVRASARRGGNTTMLAFVVAAALGAAVAMDGTLRVAIVGVLGLFALLLGREVVRVETAPDAIEELFTLTRETVSYRSREGLGWSYPRATIARLLVDARFDEPLVSLRLDDGTERAIFFLDGAHSMAVATWLLSCVEPTKVEAHFPEHVDREIRTRWFPGIDEADVRRVLAA